MGGEKLLEIQQKDIGKGSPPRGRGKDGILVHGLEKEGITPAWAGKSSCRFILGQLAWDHPRVGGEKFDKT